MELEYEYGVRYRDEEIPHRTGMTKDEAYNWIEEWREDGGAYDAFNVIKRYRSPWLSDDWGDKIATDDPRCKFCGAAAVMRVAFSKGCACYPDDRVQLLCFQHASESEPLGESEVIERFYNHKGNDDILRKREERPA